MTNHPAADASQAGGKGGGGGGGRKREKGKKMTARVQWLLE